MKSISWIVALGLAAGTAVAQDRNIDTLFSLHPCDLEAKTTGIQEYDVTLKWQNRDAIDGNSINCNGVRATYRYDPVQNRASWKDVSLARLGRLQQEVAGGTVLKAFDGFAYEAMDTAFLSEEMYRDIPPDQRDLARWLVSDAIQMHGLAGYVFDSLTYNREFIPKLLEDYDICFENWVTFYNQYQKFLWTGVGMHQDEVCAIVEFESLYSPLEIDNEQMQVKGRGLYYGEIWISLTDKEVEYAYMLEDDIIRVSNSQFPAEPLIDLQRQIVFDKVN